MDKLSPLQQELVAIGAAIASNCIPCVTYHLAKAAREGLTEGQIAEAIAVADRVRQVPAQAVLDAARRASPDAEVVGGCGCAEAAATVVP